MDIVRIVPPPGEGVKSGCGTKVLMPDGTEVPFVTSVTVTFAPDSPVRAEVEVATDFVEEISAHPLLGLDTLKASAARYGLQLVPVDGTVSCVTLSGKTIHRLIPAGPSRAPSSHG